jgi:hypothetical protein
MALSQEDKELIEARAELIAQEVCERVMVKVLASHIGTCPHGQMIFASRKLLIGIGLGAGLIGGVSGSVGEIVNRLLAAFS